MNRLNRPLKILHLILAVSATNSQYNEHCLPVLQERNITICTYFKSSQEIPREITLFEGNGSLIGFLRTLKSALLSQEYDAVHAHAIPSGILLLLALIVYGQYRKIIPSTVYTIHTSYPNLKLRNRLLIIPIFITFRKLIPCSLASFESLPPFLKYLGRNKINTIQNGVDLSRIDRILSRERNNNQDNKKFTLISVGRLINVKNPLSLLKAFYEANDLNSELVVIGDGTLKSIISEEIIKLDLSDRVKMMGLIPREEVYRYLTKADLFISTSRVEGLPVAVLEAMACRCPVILSDIPAHREIAEGVDFIPLINPEDAKGFAKEIRRFQDKTQEEKIAIGEQSRKLVEERFSLDAMHRNYEQIYLQIIQDKEKVNVMEP